VIHCLLLVTANPAYVVTPGATIVQLIVVCVWPILYGFIGWKVYLEIHWRILMKFEDNSHIRGLCHYLSLDRFACGYK
jgi:hypothetical protein